MLYLFIKYQLPHQIGMLQNAISCQPLLRIDFKHLLQQVYSLSIHLRIFRVSQIEVHFFVIFVNFFKIGAREERAGHQQNVENCSSREDIAGWCYFFTFVKRYHFGSYVAWCPTPVEDIIFSCDVSSQAEVDDDRFHIFLISQHQILRFDISMHDVVFMQLF